jgi:hypothetical protein
MEPIKEFYIAPRPQRPWRRYTVLYEQLEQPTQT